MIIRSQNKKCIVNLDNIMEIAVHDKKVVCSGSYSCVGLLAIYSTEEKAIKVLDMIQNKYFEHMTLEQNGTIMGILEKPKVFQMPADEDVEV